MAQATRLRPGEKLPPLRSGDILSRDEFERIWSLHPEIKNAELIDRVVYLDVTVSRQHARPHLAISTWIGTYAASRPGVEALDNATVRLPGPNDLQPDVLLRRLERGTSVVAVDDCVEGPPELVVEIAASSYSYDMHVKKDAYRRGGVREYVVWQQYENKLDWFVLEDGEYTTLDPDEHGMIESRQFPGLRLAVPALLVGDLQSVLAALA
ncbi:MAG: Uma2 family endonuclease [Dehalococcoidia bacterium]|nr:Uma2 family endonuclease [Dehalococcoidia bacterium]